MTYFVLLGISRATPYWEWAAEQEYYCTIWCFIIWGVPPEAVSVKAFIDYQMERMNKSRLPHYVYISEDNKIYKVKDEDIIDFLKERGVSEVYIESAPVKWLYNLLDNCFKVYTLRDKVLISNTEGNVM